MDSLGVVLKLTERCNLNCSYCYYFNGLDQSFKSKPPLLREEILEQVIIFFKNGIKCNNIKRMRITLHGGEPLLMPKHKFKELCKKLYTNLSPQLEELVFTIQTNGVLIDEEWIRIFNELSIGVGISLDGPSYYNDIYRIDHKGRGSYSKVEKSIKLLKKMNYDFGILSVINPTYDPQVIYNHLVRNLEVKGFDFLWPDYTHDRPPPYDAKQYGEFMVGILKEWKKDDDPNIQIRFLNSYINLFLGKDSLIYGQGAGGLDGTHLIVIRSDGDISVTDELMSTDPLTVTSINKNVFNTTLEDFLSIPIFSELNEAFINTPFPCQSCCWEKVCAGGGIVNRFSQTGRFNNPSIYCGGLKILFSEIFKYLIESGIPLTQIRDRLI